MSYQFEVESYEEDPLFRLVLAGVPQIYDTELETHAPYTKCDLGAIYLGGAPPSDAFEKMPAKIIASYDPEQGVLDAKAILSKPTNDACITLPGSRESLHFTDRIHAIGIGVSRSCFGLSFLGPDLCSVISPESSVNDDARKHVVSGLKLRICTKLIVKLEESAGTL